MTPTNTRKFRVEKLDWTVRRDTGVRTGASEKGYFPPAGRRGLLFSSSTGEQRFLDMGTMDLLNETQFIALSDDDLKKLLARATAP